jgi:hypothetical protein
LNRYNFTANEIAILIAGAGDKVRDIGKENGWNMPRRTLAAVAALEMILSTGCKPRKLNSAETELVCYEE